jgi:hypothetical protein
MKLIRDMMICLAAILLSVPLVYAQDLSRYRNFVLGTSLTELSKQVNETPAEVTVLQQSPALIQELTWLPIQSYPSSASTEAVQEIRFSFYNGQLYRIAAMYDSTATQGLTAADMIDAISEKYGVATRPVAAANAPAIATYSNRSETFASWGGSRYLLTLSRSPLSGTFELVLFSKQLNSQAEAATAAALIMERESAPQREAARVKKEADDLETTRQANSKAFRP